MTDNKEHSCGSGYHRHGGECCGGYHHKKEGSGHACGCGGHSHAHGDDCGCSHQHHHDHRHEHHHGEQCGCGHHHYHHSEDRPIDANAEPARRQLTELEFTILEKLRTHRVLPVVNFEIYSTKEKSLSVTALKNVLLFDPKDTMEQVVERAAAIETLERDQFIKLEFDDNFEAKPFELYYQSNVYQDFVRTVANGTEQSDFLLDEPFIYRGVMTIAHLCVQ